METSTRLALEAIVLGLRHSGTIHDHAMIVIIDELRNAAQRAREELYDQGGVQIERLALSLQCEGGGTARRNGAPKAACDATVIPKAESGRFGRATRPVWFLGIPVGSWISGFGS